MSGTKTLSGASVSPQERLLAFLLAQCPEVFTEGKIDPTKLKATLGDAIEADGERYGLSWAGKSDCFRHIQEPTTATLVPDHKASVDFEETKNIFIEGDNLQALKVLQKSYYGKVKMIYIDPPYNTGSDSFIYPDRFQESKEEYMERIGQKEEGRLTRDGMWQANSKDSGHYHSNWLNMMHPRLFLARNLLRQDGVIFVSIDENEVHNLRMIMNEVFGESNYAGEIVWKNSSKNDQAYVSIQHEYLICFVKDKETNTGDWNEKKEGLPEIYKAFAGFRKKHGDDLIKIHEEALGWYKQFPESNPIFDSKHYSWMDDRGVYFPDNISGPNFGQYRYDVFHPITKKRCKEPASGWRFPEETMKQKIKEGLIHFGKDESTVPNNKTYLKNTENQSLVSVKYKDGRVASKELTKLMGASVFTNPKDVEFIASLIRAVKVEKEDLVLDFFAGSGTTAHAVMALNAEDGGNRQCISIQLGEPCDEESEAKKAGFNTIADIARERIRRAGKKIKEDTGANIDYGFKAFTLDESNFKIWRSDVGNAEGLAKQMEMFIDNVKNDSTQENILYELMLKTGLDLNTPTEKVATKAGTYFKLSGGKLVVCIEQGMTEELADKVLAEKPEKFICLDKAFGGNDQLKTNVLLQMEQAGVDFLVI